MMTSAQPIPVAAEQRWRMFRARMLPGIIFISALLGAVFLSGGTGSPADSTGLVRSGHIACYVTDGALEISIGNGVTVQSRALPERVFDSVVISVGDAYEEVPPELRRDQSNVQWGLPVWIKLGDQASLLPGEVVDVRFHTLHDR